jgi:NitT/TauT family transport system ATP-binding protein
MPVFERQPYVQVAEVSKIYRSGTPNAVEAVSSVSFSVPHGQFVAILGPSGCGKSTLLMMVGGLESVTAGRIAVDGSAMAGPRTSISIIFQDSTLLPWKSALDNVLFPIRVLKRPLEAYRDAARQLLERVGLEDFANKKPHELSGGMRQRVAICRALVYDPELLLMDEPFSALDAITRDEMNELLLDLWQQYTKTALFVTHSIREAVFLADRVLVMTRRPATIVEDLTIPFARPRQMAIGESREFNEICGHLRERIEESHYRRPRTHPASAQPELVT